jgi:subtilisin
VSLLLRLVLGGLVVVVLAGSASVAAGSGEPEGRSRYIVVLADGADPTAAAAKHQRKYAVDVEQRYWHALKGYTASVADSAVEELRSDPDVRFVAEDAVLAAAAPTPGGCPPACALPTGVNRIDGELSSAASGNGAGVVDVDVAILDSGVDASQAELNVAGGVNCVGDGLGTTVDPGKLPHGTFAGGIIGAMDDGAGIVGIAPGARLWSVRVLEPKKGTAFISWLICGVDWVTATRTDSNLSNDIEVANMSIGGPGADDGNCGNTNGDPLHLAICTSVAAGVHYVVSAGNEAADVATKRPAAYDEVLNVTSMTDFDGLPGGLGPRPKSQPTWTCGYGSDDGPSSFSNFASLPGDQAHTVAAPGDCIYSTGVGTEYLVRSGTSFAAPHVSGVVALCVAAGPCSGLNPAQVVTKIVGDAASYNNANPSYGFQGDPLRPIAGKSYGYLIRAAAY